MKIDDLARFQGMVQERNTLLGLINNKSKAHYIGIYIPSQFELETGRQGPTSWNLHLEDKSTVDAIMALALPAAVKRVADIEAELTEADIEYQR